jgi:FMN phosphatase YigB (HAD superfamily)
MKTVLFDIDGTLADIRHRRGYLEGERPDWYRFNEAMGNDTPNIPIVALYKTLWASGDYKIEIVTGRNERFRAVTENWFVWNEIPLSSITMRPDKDFRPDSELKQDILDGLLAKGHKIAFVVDDRQQVVDMWRRNGISCLQCDVGDF